MSWKKYFSFILFCIIFSGIQAQNINKDTSYLSRLIDEAWDAPISEKTLATATEILDLSQSLNYSEGISFGLEKRALYYEYLGHYEKAIIINQELYRYGQSINDEEVVFVANLGLADIFTSLKMEDEAVAYFKKCQKISERLKNPFFPFLIQNGLGRLYLALGDFANALDYFSKAKIIAEENKLKEDKIVVEANLGLTYAELGQAALAIPLSKKILREEQANGDSLEFTLSYANLAFVHQKNRNFKEAFMYYDSSLYYAQKFDLDEIRFLTYRDMSEAFEAKSDYPEALEYHQKYQLLKDTVLTNRTRRQTNELDKLFQKEKREKELLKKQNQVQELKTAKERLWFSIAALAALLLITSLIYFRKRDRAKRELKMQQMQQDLMKIQLQNETLKAEQLESELENKQADLTNLALDIARKNEFSTQLINQLDELQKTKTDAFKTKLRDINFFVTNHLRISEDLALLQTNVDYINQTFYKNLDAKFEKLSANDKYMLGLIRLNLSNKDIAVIKGISAGSAKVMRHRLRKKLGLKPEMDFASFLQGI